MFTHGEDERALNLQQDTAEKVEKVNRELPAPLGFAAFHLRRSCPPSAEEMGLLHTSEHGKLLGDVHHQSVPSPPGYFSSQQSPATYGNRQWPGAQGPSVPALFAPDTLLRLHAGLSCLSLTLVPLSAHFSQHWISEGAKVGRRDERPAEVPWKLE